MTVTTPFASGGYAYIPGVFQYSGGVVALPGFGIERVRFAEPVPLPGASRASPRTSRPRGGR